MNVLRAALVPALAAVALAASAQSIGVSYGTGSTITTVAATDVVGAPGFTQANFNNVTAASATGLRDSLGVATTVAATLTATSSGDSVGFTPIRSNAADASERFMNGEAYAELGGLSLSLRNIPYASYSIVFYSLNAQSSAPERFTLGTTSYYTKPPANPISAGYLDNNAATPFTYVQSSAATAAAAPAGSDYVVFTGLSGASQTITMLGGSIDGNSTFPTDLGGFQIVNTTPNPTPEPSALAALGLGALGLLKRRKRA